MTSLFARDLMRREVLTVRESDSVEDLMDTLVGEHIHGAPVVNEEGKLVGIVTQQDIFFGTMNGRGEEGDEARSPKNIRVQDIMTAPAVSAGEETDVVSLCRLMYKLRIHRLPIVRAGEVAGIISSLDICAAIARGEKIA